MASEQVQSEALAEFLSTVENVDPDTARTFLEASGWDTGVAVETYFDQQENNQQTSAAPSTGAPSQGQGNWPGVGAASSQGRVKTLSELNSSKGPEEEQAPGMDMFAGGEKSGTAVRYPGIPENAGSLLDGLFSRINQPRPSGEEEENTDDEEEQPTNTSQAFRGSGFRLGDQAAPEPEPSSSLPGAFPTQSSNQFQTQSPRSSELVVRNLSLWQNGITLEDGPLLSYDSPEGIKFMEAVSSGSAPMDLLQVKPGQRVDVHVHRNLEQVYKPPSVSERPFGGSGNRLGSIVPSVGTSSNSEVEPPTEEKKDTSPGYVLDPDSPQTSLQIRLADGTRLVAKFNHSHTVGDIRAFINNASTSSRGRNYVIQTTFPIKVLDDNSITLGDANLLNAVVQQRLA